MKNILSAIAILLIVTVKAQSPEFKKNFDDGNMKYKVKSYTLAIPAFDKAIKVIAEDAESAVGAKTPMTPEKKLMSEAYAKRGACYFQTGNITGMKNDALMALSLDPDNTNAKALTAASQYKAGEKASGCKEIRNQITKGSEVAPKIFEDCNCWKEALNLAKEGETDATLRKFDDALKKLNEAIDVLPDSGFMYASRAKVWLAKSEPEKALADMNLAVAKKAHTYKIYYMRAQAFLKVNKADSALLDLNKCLEIKPDYEDGYVLRAEVNETLEQWNGAIYDYKQLIKMRPEFGRNYYKCALLMQNHHDDLLGACDMYNSAAARGVEEAKEMAANCASKKYMKQHLKSE